MTIDSAGIRNIHMTVYWKKLLMAEMQQIWTILQAKILTYTGLMSLQVSCFILVIGCTLVLLPCEWAKELI
jgi:hypothetical protein